MKCRQLVSFPKKPIDPRTRANDSLITKARPETQEGFAAKQQIRRQQDEEDDVGDVGEDLLY